MKQLIAKIDECCVDCSCIRFIYQRIPFPGGHQYELSVSKDLIYNDMNLCTNINHNSPRYEKDVRDWMFWLPHIFGKIANPNHCTDSTWVVNNISEILDNGSECFLRGECSKWIQDNEN